MEKEQTYICTFGSGQEHEGYYVKFFGTYSSARAKMVEAYGTAFCGQYDEYQWRQICQKLLEFGIPPEVELV